MVRPRGTQGLVWPGGLEGKKLWELGLVQRQDYEERRRGGLAILHDLPISGPGPATLWNLGILKL